MGKCLQTFGASVVVSIHLVRLQIILHEIDRNLVGESENFQTIYERAPIQTPLNKFDEIQNDKSVFMRETPCDTTYEDAEKSEEDYVDWMSKMVGSHLRDVWLFFFAQQSFKGDLQAECVIKWVHIMSIKMVVCIIC